MKIGTHAHQWRSVVGFEQIYDISCCGDVRRIHTQKILRPSVNRGGYLYLRLSRHGFSKSRTVHQLVAEAFIGPRPQGLVTDHIDRNKLNCRHTNLRYCTYADNSRNSDQYLHRAIRPRQEERMKSLVDWLNAGPHRKVDEGILEDVWAQFEDSNDVRAVALMFGLNPYTVAELVGDTAGLDR